MGDRGNMIGLLAHSSDPEDAVLRARAALRRHHAAPDAIYDTMLPASLLALDGDYLPDPRPLLSLYQQRRLSYGRQNSMRYRWGLSYRAEPGSVAYAASPSPRWWRPAEAELKADNIKAYGRRLMTPIVIATQFEFWGRVAEQAEDPEMARAAEALLAEATPIAEHDLAEWNMALDPWRDTFGLWLLLRHLHAVGRLRDATFALALRYAGIAQREDGVRGRKYPFHQTPFVSADAALATALWRFGVYPTLLPRLRDRVRGYQRTDGGWSDGDQPSDVLTTLVAADLLSGLDPGWDPEPTVAFLLEHQEPAGWWRALDPEVPWLTGAVAEWLDDSRRPFAERFTWPQAAIWARDRTTGLPTMAFFDELAGLLTSLGEVPIELAFSDLAHFHDFNNTFGMEAGDRALRTYAEALASIPGSLVVRDGGDEVLIVGAPTVTGSLRAQLDEFRRAWPAWAQAHADVRPGEVVPRILTVEGTAGELRRLRNALGSQIGTFKALVEDPGRFGAIAHLSPERDFSIEYDGASDG
jgi:GGDEF domain-containing protein